MNTTADKYKYPKSGKNYKDEVFYNTPTDEANVTSSVTGTYH